MLPPGSRIDEARRCPDPDCGGTAEPEQDGDHRYHECTACGYGFGYQKLETVSVSTAGACSVGIPEGIRRAASAPMESALARDAGRMPVLLQIGRPHAPSS